MPTIRKPFFVIPLALGTIVAGNAQLGNPVFNLNRAKAIGLTWKTAGNTNVWARGNFTAARSIDFMALIAANALPGTLIRLRLGTTQAEVDGVAPYDSTALAFISPSITRTDGLYHSHLELPSVITATWWRIDITGHTGDFEAATLVLGANPQTAPAVVLAFDHRPAVGQVAAPVGRELCESRHACSPISSSSKREII